MLQFNLLPDVKMEYIRTQRLKQTVVSISAVVAGAALTLLIIMILVVDVFQKSHLRDLDKDIGASNSKLQSIADLNKILTVQNQMNSLPSLHGQKPVVSRLFGYLSQVLPVKLGVSNLGIDFAQHTLQFDGEADNLNTVNQFVDTLKFATYTSGDSSPKAFSNVVLNSFSRSDKNVSYSVSLNYDSAIFDSSKDISKLNVPKIVTTRSEVDSPVTTFGGQQPANKASQ